MLNQHVQAEIDEEGAFACEEPESASEVAPMPFANAREELETFIMQIVEIRKAQLQQRRVNRSMKMIKLGNMQAAASNKRKR